MLEATIRRRLRDFSLDLTIRAGAGEVVVLMGENGAGKSSVLNCISGLMPPDSGSVRLNGCLLYDSGDGTDVPVENRNIGYVLQNPAVFPHLSVRDNIAFGLRAKHKSPGVTGERVGHWLRAMNIGDLSEVKAGKLSGGQKQRVALARAFAPEPELLMLDEPFTSLDADAIHMVKEMMRAFVSERKIPCLVVTHRIADSRDIGERVYVIRRGRREWEGKPGDIPAGVCRDGECAGYVRVQS
jgi:ABC-type sulfate/molybdate transport systems ATPase subunit